MMMGARTISKTGRAAFSRVFFPAIILFAVSFFYQGASAVSGAPLYAELFAQSNWPACTLECRRQLLETPSSHDARLLKALAEEKMGMDSSGALMAMAEDRQIPETVALSALYEAARIAWRGGDWPGAFSGFHRVFERSADTYLSIRAACSMAIIIRSHPELAEKYFWLLPQLRTFRALYTPDIIDECRLSMPKSEDSLTGIPGRLLILFYRGQIRPAIGERCSLMPNCSEYSRQAFHKHGALGLAFTADRFFREPGVVSRAEKPVDVNGRWFYADPLEDHDWWLCE